MHEPYDTCFTSKSLIGKSQNDKNIYAIDEYSIKSSYEANKNDPSVIAQHEIQEYVKEKKELYNNLKCFLENNDDYVDDFTILIETISQQRQEEAHKSLEKILLLITNISNNCHRDELLFKKIFKIIEYYEDQIKLTFSNNEIFNIFINNQKILYFLFKKEIITIDDIVYNEMESKFGNRYCYFFYPEIKKYLNEKNAKTIENELLEKDPNIFDCFDQNREEGENDSYICSLIRKDLIEEFIEYINRMHIYIDSKVNHSVFETNPFLIESKNTTLIEYAAFFGSIQVFQYLLLNNAELKPSLWLYTIHSRNADLIHLLESNNVELPNNNYIKCLCESIKCHHNEFTDYIENNMLAQDISNARKNEEVLSNMIQFHNYAYFPSDFENGDEFYYLLKFGYDKLVKLFIKKKEGSMKKMISKEINNSYYFIKSPYKKHLMKTKLKLSIIYY